MTRKNLLVINTPGDGGQNNDDGVPLGDLCSTLCDELGVALDYRETTSSEETAAVILKDGANFDGIILNPGANPNPSLAASMANLNVPAIEVHLENIFRDGGSGRPLHVPNGDVGFVCGLGTTSYLLAIRAVTQRLSE